jgi:transposase
VRDESVVACVLNSGARGQVVREVRTFGTRAWDLEALAAWLDERRVEQVALEATGATSWPVFNALEEAGLPVTLVDPRHTEGLQGRTEDVGDAARLAGLLRHGLVRPGPIPTDQVRALRELSRYRATLVRARAQEAGQLLKTLESADLNLADVASDPPGASGRQTLTAVAAGEGDPEALARMARTGLRARLDELGRACAGRVRPHQQVLIRARLDHLRFLERAIERLDLEVERAAAPFAAPVHGRTRDKEDAASIGRGAGRRVAAPRGE